MTIVSKFKEGDKVISVRDTPSVPEGWIGFITRTKPFGGYDVFANGETGDEAFFESELELLGATSTSSEIVEKKERTSALDKQVSGNHYKDCGIQPIEYIHANGLSYLEGNVIKYTTRHSKKNGKADIEKAIHYLELILEMEYKGETN